MLHEFHEEVLDLDVDPADLTNLPLDVRCSHTRLFSSGEHAQPRTAPEAAHVHHCLQHVASHRARATPTAVTPEPAPATAKTDPVTTMPTPAAPVDGDSSNPGVDGFEPASKRARSEEPQAPTASERAAADEANARAEFARVFVDWNQLRINPASITHVDGHTPQVPPHPVRDGAHVDVPRLRLRIMASDPTRARHGHPPALATSRLAGLTASAHDERVNSVAELLLGDDRTSLSDAEVGWSTMLKMNEDFVAHVRSQAWHHAWQKVAPTRQRPGASTASTAPRQSPATSRRQTGHTPSCRRLRCQDERVFAADAHSRLAPSAIKQFKQMRFFPNARTKAGKVGHRSGLRAGETLPLRCHGAQFNEGEH